MKLVLVNPPNNLFDVQDLAPPAGLLSLAAALEQEDVDIEVLDFNLRGIADPDFVDRDFYAKAVSLVQAKSPDIIGMTSMVINSHLVLELAKQLKAENPDLIVVLGGTHFSAIAEEVLHFYTWIDYIVRGEGELPLRSLLRLLKRGLKINATNAPMNVAFRDGGQVTSSQQMKPMDSLDQLPFPAYHLVNVEDYFRLNRKRVVDFEPGRGCIFKCSFCYSPVHYGQGSQVKTIDHVLAEMHRLQELGAGHLFFVQDNFLNDVRFTRELCRAMAGAKFNLSWNCYATLPQMNEEMIQLLSRAGCTQVFTGVDAVNEEYQKQYLKRFYKGWEPFERMLKCCLQHNITPTFAFLVEDPTKGTNLTDKTLTTALFARCSGAGVRLNTLTLYNKTAEAVSLKTPLLTYSELKPKLLLDCPEVVYTNEYARERPELFPFHCTPLPPNVWRRFGVGMHLAFTLFRSFPMTLLRYVTEDKGSLWGLMDSFIDELIDLPHIQPHARRPLERTTFIKQFKEQTQLSPQTKQAFELEVAELNVSASRGARPLRVKSEASDETRDMVLNNYELTTLNYDVAELHRFHLSDTSESGDPRRIMLTCNGKQIEYYRLKEPIFDVLSKLKHGESDVAHMDSAMLEALKSIGILSESMTARTI